MKRNIDGIELTLHNNVWVAADGTTFMRSGKTQDRFGINKTSWLVNGVKVEGTGNCLLDDIVRRTFKGSK